MGLRIENPAEHIRHVHDQGGDLRWRGGQTVPDQRRGRVAGRDRRQPHPVGRGDCRGGWDALRPVAGRCAARLQGGCRRAATKGIRPVRRQLSKHGPLRRRRDAGRPGGAHRPGSGRDRALGRERHRQCHHRLRGSWRQVGHPGRDQPGRGAVHPAGRSAVGVHGECAGAHHRRGWRQFHLDRGETDGSRRFCAGGQRQSAGVRQYVLRRP